MNLLIVLAVTVCISPIAVEESILSFEFPAMVFVAMMLYFVCRLGGLKITRAKGVLFLLVYVGVMYSSFQRTRQLDPATQPLTHVQQDR